MTALTKIGMALVVLPLAAVFVWVLGEAGALVLSGDRADRLAGAFMLALISMASGSALVILGSDRRRQEGTR